jgi:DNA invertase Pin-like site-specific DNA recombinase
LFRKVSIAQTEGKPMSKTQNLSELPVSRERKIKRQHQERLAVVYIRQSSMNQVQQNQESTQLQYGLVSHAISLGWPKERVLVIDDDLGVSGATAEGRIGFQRLLSDIALNHVGMILGVEMSRLARSCKDWYQLLELCGLFDTLICDLDGVYDPSNYNDRLLLGLKGTMSEAELHVIRQRMWQGALQKARRGELITKGPMGYMRSGDTLILDPDEQAQSVIRLVFDRFERLGAMHAVLRSFVVEGIKLPVRSASRINRGELEWRTPNSTAIQNRLEQNRSRWDTRGSIRQGTALLAGLVVCGRCGYRLRTQYGGYNTKPRGGGRFFVKSVGSWRASHVSFLITRLAFSWHPAIVSQRRLLNRKSDQKPNSIADRSLASGPHPADFPFV